MASGQFALAQLAEAVGMSTVDVEVCLDEGLLAPPRRQRGRRGVTAFHQEHVQRLVVIHRCLELGFSLQEIRLIVDPSILLTCRDVYDLTEPHVGRLMEDGKSDAAAWLAALREECPKVGGRQNCPIVAALHDGAERREQCPPAPVQGLRLP